MIHWSSSERNRSPSKISFDIKSSLRTCFRPDATQNTYAVSKTGKTNVYDAQRETLNTLQVMGFLEILLRWKLVVKFITEKALMDL